MKALVMQGPWVGGAVADQDDLHLLLAEHAVPQAGQDRGLHGGGGPVAVHGGRGEGGGGGQVGQWAQLVALAPRPPTFADPRWGQGVEGGVAA